MILTLVLFTLVILSARYAVNRSDKVVVTDHGFVSRAVKFKAYLASKEFPSSCIDTSEHVPMIVSTPERPTELVAVVCQVCSDSLPAPDWATCSECLFVVLDGFVYHQPCPKHNQEIESRQ